MLCRRVCPFVSDNADEDVIGEALYGSDGMFHSPDVGWFSECFQAWAPDEPVRVRGASGGVATWLLTSLLEDEEITGAWCVRPGAASEQPTYSLVRTSEELACCAGSTYYPVHLAEVVRDCMSASDDERYAVVVLPCQAHALRLAQRAIPQFNGARMPLIIGLACGHGKTSWFTDNLATHCGRPGETLVDVSYRVKRPQHPSADFGMELRYAGPSGPRCVTLTASADLGRLWERREDSAYGCCFCDDLFAECADVVLMDAWLPEVVSDWRGTSLVATRTEAISTRFSTLVESGSASLTAVERLLESQTRGIAEKRGGVALREGWARVLRLPYLTRRGVIHRAGRVQRLGWFGAYLIASGSRLGRDETPYGPVLTATGRTISWMAESMSRIVMQIKSRMAHAGRVRS